MRKSLVDLKQGHTLLSYLKARHTNRRIAKGLRPMPMAPDDTAVIAAQKATIAAAHAANASNNIISNNLWETLQVE